MTAKEEALTVGRLRELLDYNPETGEFRWRVHRADNARSGSVAGSLNHGGYWRVSIQGHTYLAHRLAWLYVHGEWPTTGIDHKNGVTEDNRIANLREATQMENGGNKRKAHINSKTGLLGTSWHSPTKKFLAQIQLDGKNTYLGLFKTAEEAHQAYLKAKRELHPFCTL